MTERSGGTIIGEVLEQRGVEQLFTLCGGHISPILVDAKARGIRVVDVRDEKSAVFAADAACRMGGVPGVAAVTAGPGVTNSVTAVKNAQMAQSPLVLFGGCAPTLLKGRGALQDIEQISLMEPITKWATSVKTHAQLEKVIPRAFDMAESGVPGPVFVEIPVDLLYPESLVRDWYFKESGVQDSDKLGARALEWYLKGHLYRQFHAPSVELDLPLPELRDLKPRRAHSQVRDVASRLAEAKRPVLVIGSQAMIGCREPESLAEAVRRLGIPTYLAGTARGLLGRQSDIQFRHKRSKALKEADLALIAGFPFDFRLNYGRSISSRATLVAANLSSTELRKNRRPDVPIEMHPRTFLEQLSEQAAGSAGPWSSWYETLQTREQEREREIDEQATQSGEGINPIAFFRRLEPRIDDDAVLIVDGGDFVATAAYTLRPRGPLSWLDPGVFGTLGVGGGFALGASLCRPSSEVWLLYGDGSCAYSLAEFDTCIRHGLAPIAVVGNDGSWAQIARDQVEVLGDEVGTKLLRTAYHKVAEGYGGVGLLLDDPDRIDEVLSEAKRRAREGTPVLINVHIAKSDFRKGSISM